MDDMSEIRGDIRELRVRTTVLIWVVGILAGAFIATLGTSITQSYQLGQVIGRLDVLISHAELK